MTCWDGCLTGCFECASLVSIMRLWQHRHRCLNALWMHMGVWMRSWQAGYWWLNEHMLCLGVWMRLWQPSHGCFEYTMDALPPTKHQRHRAPLPYNRAYLQTLNTLRAISLSDQFSQNNNFNPIPETWQYPVKTSVKQIVGNPITQRVLWYVKLRHSQQQRWK